MKLCLLGAECTGKTTLATALAQSLDWLCVPEYLREFVTLHGRAPTQDEQLGVLNTQIARENETLALARQQGKPGIVCDTAPLLTAVYSAHYFGDRSLLPYALAHHACYTHTLLLEPDLPWQGDGAQRDGPAARNAVHALLNETLNRAHIPFTRIYGTPLQRLRAARNCVT